MREALIFLTAFTILFAIAYTTKKSEGFQNLLGVNWKTKNEGTPPNCNSRFKPTHPVLPVAQQGVGTLEPSPPPASDIPSAPTGFHSKETPNP
jgi:hypothetical protein